ncbi:MAG: tRNA pseudouridine(38-40) synthase TruA [Campylobacterales bacterium]|nr:tRNA pseudouridine(38-40) synthase TruA [Campylobacterales bacterium]
MRAFLTLAYDGSRFGGFQQQAHDTNTVMQCLITALRKLNIFSTPAGAGRTDKGVHALGQVVHVDLPPHWRDTSLLQSALNPHLAPYATITKITLTDGTLHARYSAKARQYRYVVDHGTFSPFLAPYRLFQAQPLSLGRVNDALACFIGIHDFSLFKKVGSPTTHNIRILFDARAYTHKQLSIFSFRGSGFLRSQVRMMIGAALAHERGILSLEDLQAQLTNKRQVFTKPVPPNGLYLTRIYY